MDRFEGITPPTIDIKDLFQELIEDFPLSKPHCARKVMIRIFDKLKYELIPKNLVDNFHKPDRSIPDINKFVTSSSLMQECLI